MTGLVKCGAIQSGFLFACGHTFTMLLLYNVLHLATFSQYAALLMHVPWCIYMACVALFNFNCSNSNESEEKGCLSHTLLQGSNLFLAYEFSFALLFIVVILGSF